MAEPVGIFASVVTITTLVGKFRSLRSKLKHAEQWMEYSNGLEVLRSIQQALGEVSKMSPSSSTLTVTIEKKTENLIEYCNLQLTRVVHVAQRVLDKLEHPHTLKRAKIRDKFLWWKRVILAFDEEEIRDLIRGVEFAKSSLLLAMQVVSLSCVVKSDESAREDHVQTRDLVERESAKLLRAMERLEKESEEFRLRCSAMVERDSEAMNQQSRDSLDGSAIAQPNDLSTASRERLDGSEVSSISLVQTVSDAGEEVPENQSYPDALVVMPCRNDSVLNVYGPMPPETSTHENTNMTSSIRFPIAMSTGICELDPAIRTCQDRLPLYRHIPVVQLWRHFVKCDPTCWKLLPSNTSTSLPRIEYKCLPSWTPCSISRSTDLEKCKKDRVGMMRFCFAEIVLDNTERTLEGPDKLAMWNWGKTLQDTEAQKGYISLRKSCATSAMCEHVTIEVRDGVLARRNISVPLSVTLPEIRSGPGRHRVLGAEAVNLLPHGCGDCRHTSLRMVERDSNSISVACVAKKRITGVFGLASQEGWGRFVTNAVDSVLIQRDILYAHYTVATVFIRTRASSGVIVR